MKKIFNLVLVCVVAFGFSCQNATEDHIPEPTLPASVSGEVQALESYYTQLNQDMLSRFKELSAQPRLRALTTQQVLKDPTLDSASFEELIASNGYSKLCNDEMIKILSYLDEGFALPTAQEISRMPLTDEEKVFLITGCATVRAVSEGVAQNLFRGEELRMYTGGVPPTVVTTVRPDCDELKSQEKKRRILIRVKKVTDEASDNGFIGLITGWALGGPKGAVVTGSAAFLGTLVVKGAREVVNYIYVDQEEIEQQFKDCKEKEPTSTKGGCSVPSLPVYPVTSAPVAFVPADTLSPPAVGSIGITGISVNR